MARLDPRLSDARLLALAALRLRARGPAVEQVTLRVVYVDSLTQAVEEWPSYVITVPLGQLRSQP